MMLEYMMDDLVEHFNYRRLDFQRIWWGTQARQYKYLRNTNAWLAFNNYRSLIAI